MLSDFLFNYIMSKINYSKIPIINPLEFDKIKDSTTYEIRTIFNINIRVLKENNYISYADIRNYYIKIENYTGGNKKSGNFIKWITSNYAEFIKYLNTTILISRRTENIRSVCDFLHPSLFFSILKYLSDRLFLDILHHYFKSNKFNFINNISFIEEELYSGKKVLNRNYTDFYTFDSVVAHKNNINMNNIIKEFNTRYNLNFYIDQSRPYDNVAYLTYFKDILNIELSYQYENVRYSNQIVFHLILSTFNVFAYMNIVYDYYNFENQIEANSIDYSIDFNNSPGYDINNNFRIVVHGNIDDETDKLLVDKRISYFQAQYTAKLLNPTKAKKLDRFFNDDETKLFMSKLNEKIINHKEMKLKIDEFLNNNPKYSYIEEYKYCYYIDKNINTTEKREINLLIDYYSDISTIIDEK